MPEQRPGTTLVVLTPGHYRACIVTAFGAGFLLAFLIWGLA